jgi:hypothetical protein
MPHFSWARERMVAVKCPKHLISHRSWTRFGLSAVTAMVICYALENRSHWFILTFAGSCVLGSVYGFLQGAWPFGLVEAIRFVAAARCWFLIKSSKK